MPSSSKAPFLIFSLIGAILCLSVGAIALIVLFNANRPDSVAIAAACKAEVGAAIKIESEKVTKACEEAAKTKTIVVSANTRRPGFSYPAGWSAVGELREEKLTPLDSIQTYSVVVSPGFMDHSCVDCGGPIFAVNMDTRPKSEFPQLGVKTLKDLVTAAYPPDEKVTLTDEVINGKSVVIAKGAFSGAIDYQINEVIWYATDKNVTQVEFDLWKGAPAGVEDGWKIIRASLDFSKIE